MSNEQFMYSVYDLKAECYAQPFYADTDGVAVRMFIQACNEPEHAFFTHAEDYCLFKLGTFDAKNGMVTPVATPEPLMQAHQAKEVNSRPAKSEG